MKWVNVILAIDERMDDVRKCVASLRAVYGPGVPIALATYGAPSVKAQPGVAAYAAENGFTYVDLPRHDFLTDEDRSEWHACEILVRTEITSHFADQGIEEVYVMHADVRAIADFRARFQEKATGRWSFIAIMVRASEPFEDLCERGSWGLYFEGNRARLADVLTRYSSSFVGQLYERYGTNLGIWENLLSKFTLWGDLAQFDMAREIMGFTGRCFVDKSDYGSLCHGTIVHSPKQAIPGCLPEDTKRGIDRAGILRNYERRAR
jgi:hypothetical protein